MSFVNYRAQCIHCKVVYAGANAAGKTASLQQIYQKISQQPPPAVAPPPQSPPLDFLPLSLGTLRGFVTRFHLYSAPRPGLFDGARRLILRGIDGIVLVVDRRLERLPANQAALATLQRELAAQGTPLLQLPGVVQLTHGDAPSALPPAALLAALRLGTWPAFCSNPRSGDGVLTALRQAARGVLLTLQASGSRPEPGNPVAGSACRP